MSTQQPSITVRRRWYAAGLVSVLSSYVLLVAMQVLENDWLPPKISISQYGVGRWGWVFSLFLIGFAAAPLLTERALPSGRTVRILLLLGLLGCLVMAFVPTDPGGLQQSARAKVHMVGSVFGLSMTPLGALGAMLTHRRIPIRLPIVLAVVSTVSIVLLLISATGVDTLGVGRETSWAIWQTVAALADLVLVGVMSFAHRPRAGDPAPVEGRHGPPTDRGLPLARRQLIRDSDGADT